MTALPVIGLFFFLSGAGNWEAVPVMAYFESLKACRDAVPAVLAQVRAEHPDDSDLAAYCLPIKDLIVVKKGVTL